jgi:L-threonylcarbamoyladenylate synthase
MRRIAIDELLGSVEEVGRFAARIALGGVAAVPTETFYALAADPLSETGVRRVRQIKGRDDGKPLLVLFGARRQLEPLGVAASAGRLDALFRIWPAPLTAVLPLRAPIPASLGSSTLGVRLPDHERLRELLARTSAVTGTSANRSGEEPCTRADEVARIFGDEIDVLVDGGRTPGGAPSTVVDATVDPPRVLRAGAFPWPPEPRR